MSDVKRFMCVRVLDDDGETFYPTHVRVVTEIDYDALKAQLEDQQRDNKRLMHHVRKSPAMSNQYVKMAEEEIMRLRAFIANPPKHQFWGAGERDCPEDVKGGNGELHKLRCKACGITSPPDVICRATEGKP